METRSKNDVGKISLYVAIGGVVGGAALGLLFVLVESLTQAEMPISLFVLLFVVEVVALVAGIAGCGSAYGKTGFGAALILLAMTTFFVPISSRVVTEQGDKVEPVMVTERTQRAFQD